MLKLSTHRALFGLAVLLLIIHAGIFIRFTIDDAYITFTYTKNLSLGNGPVFTPGNHVEATSSMLWAILLVPFETFLNNGAVIGSKILGILALLGTEFVGILLIRELLGTNPYAGNAKLAFSFLLAGASPFVVWGVYGMENGLVAILLTISVLLFLKEQQSGQGFASAFVIFLLETVRPEGFVYISLFVGFRLLIAFHPENKAHLKRNLNWICLLAGCLIIYEIFGLAYFGHLLPNTVQAKVGGMSYERFIAGVHYLIAPYAFLYSILLLLCSQLLLLHFFIIIIGRIANFFSQLIRNETPILFIYCILAVHWVFVIYVGGDWMPNARFLSHFIPLLLVLLVVMFSQVANKLLPTKKSPTVNAIILIISIFFLAHL